ncbi:MAG: restriction endonuclease subunit S [Aerococcus viridans]|nr:MAG: restriction endonuclease subunit S [Aerococcus viridans]
MGINKDSQKAPNLRFKGFTDDWEQRKFGNFIEEYVEKTTSQNQYPVLTSSQQVGIVLQEDYFSNRQVTTSKNIGYFVLPKGYFTYRSRSDNGVFVFNRNDSIDKGIISYFYPVFRVINADSDFFLRRINFGVGHQIAIAAEGTGQHVLSLKKFKDIRAMFPVIQEQVKIGNLFSQLDIIITLHQRKLDQLNQLKAALLQQMFPGKGETVPKLRFAGFEGEWEEHKLGELSNVVGGGTPSTSNPEYWDGDIDWYAPAEIGEQNYVSKSKKTITELGLKKSSARILPVGTVLFTSRAGIGNTAILAKEATTNQGFQSIVPDQNKLDSYFIFSRTNELKRYGEVTGSGSTFVEVSGKQMSKMPIMVPVLSEQQRIGLFFKQLDDTITLQQRKLEQLQDIKQVLLQNMFI